MLFSMTWNGPESKSLTSFPKAKAIHRSLNLLPNHRLPVSTDETDPSSPSESFSDLPYSAGGCGFPVAAAVPRQLPLSPASGNQRKPPFLEVHTGAAKEPPNRQHYLWPLSTGLLWRSADKTRGSRASP